MILLRIVFVWFIVFVLILFLFVLAIVACFRGFKPIEKEKLAKLPVINEFLASKAR